MLPVFHSEVLPASCSLVVRTSFLVSTPFQGLNGPPRERKPAREAARTIPTDVSSTLPETPISATCGFHQQGAGIWGAPNGRWPEV